MTDAEIGIKISGEFSGKPFLIKKAGTFESIGDMKLKTVGGWRNIVVPGGGGGEDWEILTLYADQWSGLNIPTDEAVKANDVFIRPDDGKTFYVPVSSHLEIRQYSSTNAWDLQPSGVAYDGKVLDISGKIGIAQYLFVKFKPDGSELYVKNGFKGTDRNIHQYTLETPWDISTASFTTTFDLDVASNFQPGGMEFKPDGKKLYVTSADLKKINEYNLTTAWDISTAELDTSHDISGLSLKPASIVCNPNGKQIFLTTKTGNIVNECSLSTPWDFSTISFEKEIPIMTDAFHFENQPYINNVCFKPDGTKAFGACRLKSYDEMEEADVYSILVFSFDSLTE